MSEAQRGLGVLAVVVALGTVFAVFGSRLLGLAAGPEPEILTVLKKAEAHPDTVQVGPLVKVLKLSYQRLTVLVEPSGERALVTGTLDFEGQLGESRLATKVSSLGYERLPFVLREGSWEPEEGWAPRLQKAVEALEARRRALEAYDVAALRRLSGGLDGGLAGLEELAVMRGRALKVEAWLLRSEPSGALVSEEARLTGSLPDRPVEDTAARRLNLAWDGAGFFFPEGFL